MGGANQSKIGQSKMAGSQMGGINQSKMGQSNIGNSNIDAFPFESQIGNKNLVKYIVMKMMK